MKKILVTGANGQLGRCIKKIETQYTDYHFIFASRSELDISNRASLLFLFDDYKFDYCINCAAYTQVDKAEKEPKEAYRINALAVKYLAEVCKQYNTLLIHISTDYVFDGQSSKAYKITDTTNPINVYGETKLKGELAIQQTMNRFFIIRTSWVYSEYEKNFYNTICQKLEEKQTLYVVNDQIGCPTNANDIASCIMKLICKKEMFAYGLYHFCGDKIMSWYDFAKQIKEEKQSNTEIKPVDSNYYPTVAKRPKFSILEKNIFL